MQLFIRKTKKKVGSSSFLSLFSLILTISTVSRLYATNDNLNCNVLPVIEWQKSLGGSNQDYGYSMQ